MKISDYFPRGKVIKLGVSPDGKNIVFSTERHRDFPLLDDGMEATLYALNNLDEISEKQIKTEQLFIKYMKSISESEGVEPDYYMNSVGSEQVFSPEEIEYIRKLTSTQN